MNLLQTLIMSLIEGLTEFLPVSSTGHMILTAELLRIEQTEFVKSFEIIIQFGAILSVLFLYFRTLVKKRSWWPKILVAFLPTALIGFFAYAIFKDFLIGNSFIVVAALFFGALIMLIVEKHFEKTGSAEKGKDIEELSLLDAIKIGTLQSFSIIPGVSRSMSSIFAGIFVGLKRKAAVEFSFLLAIPTMMAASAYDLFKNQLSFDIEEWKLLAFGFLLAFFTALLSVKLLLRFVEKHSLKGFAYYRIALAGFFLIFLLTR